MYLIKRNRSDQKREQQLINDGEKHFANVEPIDEKLRTETKEHKPVHLDNHIKDLKHFQDRFSKKGTSQGDHMARALEREIRGQKEQGSRSGLKK